MKLSLTTYELTKEKGNFIAMVDWYRYDGGEVGTPGAVKYGNSKEEAYNSLKELLETRGHEIIK
jgi:hypothetical protein